MKKLKLQAAAQFFVMMGLGLLFTSHWVTAQTAKNVSLVGRWANGPCLAVAVAGNIAYFGNGGYLEIVDFSNPGNPVELGKVLISGVVRGIAVSGSYAYVADPDAGLRVIDVSNPYQPKQVVSLATDGPAIDVAVSNSFAYVAAGSSGLWVIDIFTPSNPKAVGVFDTTGNVMAVAVSGSYAYVAHGSVGSYVAADSAGLWVIDISIPSNPRRVGSFDTPGYAVDVTVSGSYAYLVDNSYALDDSAGLQIINVSKPDQPMKEGLFNPFGSSFDVKGVAVSGSYVYVAEQDGCWVIDVSNPSNPKKEGFFKPSGIDAYGVAVSGSHAYVAEWHDGLRIIDVSKPSQPMEARFFDTPGQANGVAVSGSHAYVADGYDGGLQVIDISTPAQPGRVGFFDTPGQAYGVAVSGSYVYLADWFDGLYILHVENQAPSEKVSVFPNPFTPNQDGFNDYVDFKLPDTLTESAEIFIFNISGRRVQKASVANSQSFQWHGTDDGGRLLEPGVYIYLIRSDGKNISSGTITLMR